MGLPPNFERPAQLPDLIPESFHVMLEEHVPVFSVGLGNPGAEMVEACHRHGIKVIAMVTTAEDARAVEATGLDAVVAQGAEAGGHRSHFAKPASREVGVVGTVALVPEVVDAVRIPVIAAGGIADGRGLVSALALEPAHFDGHPLCGDPGIDGARDAQESPAGALRQCHDPDGCPEWAVCTGASQRLHGRLCPQRAFVLPFPWHYVNASDIYREGTAQGNADYVPLWGGQSVGVIHDLPEAAEVVETIIREARALLLARLSQTVQIEQ